MSLTERSLFEQCVLASGLLTEKQLDEARGYLRKFLADHPLHTLVTSTNRYLATTLIEQAELKTEQAREPNRPPTEKQRLRLQGQSSVAYHNRKCQAFC